MTQNMSEDEIDDLLYLARIGDIEDFTSFSQELCTKYEYSKQQLVELARDPESGNGMLHMAAANGHLTFLKSVLSGIHINSSPIFLNAQNKAGNTPLHWAALNGHLECVKPLLEAGADPTIKNAAGHDPVYEAEMADKKDVVEYVLKEGGTELEKGVGHVGETEEEMDSVVDGAGENFEDEVAKEDLEGEETGP